MLLEELSLISWAQHTFLLLLGKHMETNTLKPRTQEGCGMEPFRKT